MSTYMGLMDHLAGQQSLSGGPGTGVHLDRTGICKLSALFIARAPLAGDVTITFESAPCDSAQLPCPCPDEKAWAPIYERGCDAPENQMVGVVLGVDDNQIINEACGATDEFGPVRLIDVPDCPGNRFVRPVATGAGDYDIIWIAEPLDKRKGKGCVGIANCLPQVETVEFDPTAIP